MPNLWRKSKEVTLRRLGPVFTRARAPRGDTYLVDFGQFCYKRPAAAVGAAVVSACMQVKRRMKNFLRALRFAWPYRGRLFWSCVAAILAAVFWSLNFTAIYPVLKILGSEKNLQQWVDDSIKETETRIDVLQNSVDILNKEKQQIELRPLPDRIRALRHNADDAAKHQSKLDSASTELYRYHVAKRYIDWLFPTDRFQTLAFVIFLVCVAVALKGVFEFLQETLVGSVVNMSLYDMRNRFYRKAIHLDVANFSQQGTPELMARFTNDMELLGNGKKMLFGKMIAEPLRALGCVVVACWISWQLTLMFLLVVPVALYLLMKVSMTVSASVPIGWPKDGPASVFVKSSSVPLSLHRYGPKSTATTRKARMNSPAIASRSRVNVYQASLHSERGGRWTSWTPMAPADVCACVAI